LIDDLNEAIDFHGLAQISIDSFKRCSGLQLPEITTTGMSLSGGSEARNFKNPRPSITGIDRSSGFFFSYPELFDHFPPAEPYSLLLEAVRTSLP
jgi:hypothetical protein